MPFGERSFQNPPFCKPSSNHRHNCELTLGRKLLYIFPSPRALIYINFGACFALFFKSGAEKQSGRRRYIYLLLLLLLYIYFFIPEGRNRRFKGAGEEVPKKVKLYIFQDLDSFQLLFRKGPRFECENIYNLMTATSITVTVTPP